MPENIQGGETPTEVVASPASAVAGMPTPDAVEAGTPTPVVQPIDWSSFDVTQIPEDVIKASVSYKQVLEESIARRKEIADLKKGQSVKTPAVPDEVPAWAKSLIDSVTTLVTKDTQNARKDLAKKHGVPDDIAGAISGETIEDFEANLKVVGEAIKKSGGATGRTSPGNPAGDGDVLGTLRNRIKNKAQDKGVESASPFDPGVQITRGGGAVRS